MPIYGSRRIIGSAIAVGAALSLVVGCSADDAESDKSGTFYGPSQNLGNGTVKAYTVLDKSGNPSEIGLRISESALEGLPATDPAPQQPLTVHLAFPDQAEPTVFDHVMLNWNAQGHEPVPLFGKPHFDFHFSMVDMGAVQAVNPANPNFGQLAANSPQPQYIPKDYVQVPDSTVPFMGVHWADSTQQLIPGQYDFKSILINGSWDGKYTFLEPMVALDYLRSKPDLSETVKQPQAFQKAGYFPTTYQIRYDDSAKEYAIVLGGLERKAAS